MRVVLLLAFLLAGARAECRDPKTVTEEELNVSVCCCGGDCCSGKVGDTGECCSEDNPAPTTRLGPAVPAPDEKEDEPELSQLAATHPK